MARLSLNCMHMSITQKVFCVLFFLTTVLGGWAFVDNSMRLYAKWQSATRRIGFFIQRVEQLEERIRVAELKHQQCVKDIGELQQWRMHVSVASRMGWNQANRYIQQFPLN